MTKNGVSASTGHLAISDMTMIGNCNSGYVCIRPYVDTDFY